MMSELLPPLPVEVLGVHLTVLQIALTVTMGFHPPDNPESPHLRVTHSSFTHSSVLTEYHHVLGHLSRACCPVGGGPSARPHEDPLPCHCLSVCQ